MSHLDRPVAAAFLAVGNMGFGGGDPVVDGAVVGFSSPYSVSADLKLVVDPRAQEHASQIVLDSLISGIADSDDTERAFNEELESWLELLSGSDWDRSKILKTWPWLSTVFQALDLALSQGALK